MSKKTIFATGRLFELVHIEQPDGRVFEVACRAPGVRLIIDDPEAGTLLITKEYRRELGDWDYRLPGGKVFDSLEEYGAHRESGKEMSEVARAKAEAEALEEAGIVVEECILYKTSTLGATIEWDLLFFAVNKWHRHEGGQRLETGEQIEANHQFKYSEVKNMILQSKMREERAALILLQLLLQWMVQNHKITV